LTEKYKNDAALQKAWNRTNASLKAAQVPTYEERINQPLVIDPSKIHLSKTVSIRYSSETSTPNSFNCFANAIIINLALDERGMLFFNMFNMRLSNDIV